MISLDTNVLLPALELRNPLHDRAAQFLASLVNRNDVVLSELSLLELYGLLRNASVVPRPRSGDQAVDLINQLRANPTWTMVALPVNSGAFHDAMWDRLRDNAIARRRAYDIRLALSLQAFGVDEFATANVRDFQELGFRRVWNPLAGA